MKKEFKIGDIVTLDRFNHIEDVELVTIVGYGKMHLSETLTYQMDVRGVVIESTGGSIMESRKYSPVDNKERNSRLE
jgi:hypothetical protein